MAPEGGRRPRDRQSRFLPSPVASPRLRGVRLVAVGLVAVVPPPVGVGLTGKAGVDAAAAAVAAAAVVVAAESGAETLAVS